MRRDGFAVILVFGTSHAIRAEHLLNRAEVACKMIPVPRHLSSNCGVCVRIERTDVDEARRVLEQGRLEIESIHET